MKKPSICILAHNAYGNLADMDIGHIGGIEVQTPLMARWLARNKYPVSIICWDKGQEDGVTISEIKVYKLCKSDDGLPVVRFFWPRWTSLLAALKRANPDIVYYNCGDLGLGQVTHWAKRNRKQTVYSVANDPDCEKNLPALKPLRERLLYRYGLKHCNHIISQTQTQKRLLKRNFDRDATVIPMPCEGFPTKYDFEAKAKQTTDVSVLWVGRFTPQKRLDWLLNVAEKLPNINFDVIGSDNENSNYSRNLLERAKGISNLSLLGRVAHNKMGAEYNRAKLIISTSAWEGFPNVFLEAWSTGLPLITTFDPDGVVSTHNTGIVANDVDSIANAIQEAIKPEIWKSLSTNARNYYEQNHTLECSMQAFASVFDSAQQSK